MVIFTACFSAMKAQERETATLQAVSFYYDAAGSRTARSLVLNMTAQPAPGQEESGDERREEIKAEDMMVVEAPKQRNTREENERIKSGNGKDLEQATGPVVVEDGISVVHAASSILIKDGFEVKKGAEFEMKTNGIW